MKVYTNLEALTMLEENPNIRFKNKHLLMYKNYLDDIYIERLDGTTNGSPCALSGGWELVQKPVSFMEAINSGKMIKYEGWSNYHSTQNAIADINARCSDAQLQILNGNWCIEEDEE